MAMGVTVKLIYTNSNQPLETKGESRLTLKKVLPLAMALIIAASFLRTPDVHAAAPTVVVSSVYNLTEPNVALLINITVSDVSDLAMWVFNLAWDPQMIQLNTGDAAGLLKKGVRYDVYEGPFLKSIRSTLFAANSINITAGEIAVLAAGYANAGGGATASGSGTLVSFNFTSLQVGTAWINITGPSAIALGEGMLIDHFGKEIAHDQVQGVVTDQGPPPPPPFWTQLWFQVALIVVIVAVVAGYIVVKVVMPARARAKAREAEEIVEEEKTVQEEIEKGFL
jgi:hypothetical protein